MFGRPHFAHAVEVLASNQGNQPTSRFCALLSPKSAMARLRLYHLTLLSVFFFLILTGLEAADPPGEKKVTMTIQFPPADSPPEEKITISTHYVREDGVGDSHVHLDCDDHEPQLGSAVKHLLRSLEKIRDEEASLSEAYDMPSEWMQVLFHLVSGKIRRDLLYYRSIMSARSSFARANNHSVLEALSTSNY